MEEQFLTNQINAEGKEKESIPFFRILYRNLVLIVIFTIAFVMLGAFYSIFMIKPVYTAQCDAIINVRFESGAESTTRGTSIAKNSLMTFSDFIKTSAVEKTARENSQDSGISRSAVGVSYSTDSLIITISYTASTPEDATKRLSAYISAADTEFQKKKPIESVRAISLVELQNKYIVSESKGSMKYVLIGLFVGAALGVGIAMLRYLLDNKLKDKAELEELTGVSLLSYIDKQ